MNKSLITVKKTIFIMLMICSAAGFLYYFIAAFSYFDAVQDFLYNNNIDSYFYDDSLILPMVVFVPVFIITNVIVWVFFRKETSLLFRILLTALSVWSIAAWYINILINLEFSENLRFLSFIPISASAVIAVFMVKELINDNIKCKNQ